MLCWMMIKISLILYFISLKLFYSIRLPVKLFSKQITKMISLLAPKAAPLFAVVYENLTISFISLPSTLPHKKKELKSSKALLKREHLACLSQKNAGL